MQKLEIYCNYGVLGSEKRNVYTCGAEHVHAVCSDRMTVVVPDEWELYKNPAGTAMVKAPWGECFEVNEVLQGKEKPCFYALDGNMKGHRVYLKEVADE